MTVLNTLHTSRSANHILMRQAFNQSTTNATKAVNNTADADATALLSMMDSTTSTTPPIA